MTELVKKCKQCGKTKNTAAGFRKYYARGKGIYNSSQGYNTICRECEAHNAAVVRIWNKPDKTPEDERTLELAAEIVRRRAAAGLDPIGAYARYVLGKQTQRTFVLDSIEETLSDLDTMKDAIMVEYEQLLTTLSIGGYMTEDPDVYNAMLDAIDDKAPQVNGRPHEMYRPVRDKLLDLLAEYEDSYEY